MSSAACMMSPGSDFEEMEIKLAERFRELERSGSPAKVRMVGIVFARPGSPLAKAEIIPQINDWHVRSGEHIDFFFVGYNDRPQEPGSISVEIPGASPWYYTASQFDIFRREIESRTSWRHGGGCELLLTNARFYSRTQDAKIDFTSTICCQLDIMKTDHAIVSIERFFEAVFRFAESSEGDDPTWGFSDEQGIKIAGSALKRVVLSLLPKGIDAEYRKAENFVVRNVAPREQHL